MTQFRRQQSMRKPTLQTEGDGTDEVDEAEEEDKPNEADEGDENLATASSSCASFNPA